MQKEKSDGVLREKNNKMAQNLLINLGGLRGVDQNMKKNIPLRRCKPGTEKQ